MRVYPEFTVDGEFAKLGTDGFSGSLNDRQFAFLRSRGFTNSLTDMFAEYSKGFSPAVLFANSEPGAWYDPSDLTTMFQDRAGTTPVTAPGQSVGLVLDKSKGLVLGPELVTNGGFDTDTDWTKGAGWTISGGVAYKSPGSTAQLTQDVLFKDDTTYRVTVDVTLVSSTCVIELKGSGAGGVSRVINTSGVSTFYIKTATSVVGTKQVAFAVQTSTAEYSVNNISVREIPGFHMVANSDAARGSYNVDEAGRGFILFDGVDDGYVTPTITPGTDKAQVFAGVRKLSDAAVAVFVELSATTNSNAGSFYLAAPENTVVRYSTLSRGTTASSGNQNAYTTSGTAPDTCVLTATHEIATDASILRRNGVQVGSASGDKGTGNFLAYPLYIGRRGGTTLPFNGRLYSLIVRFGPNLTADQIAATEAWVNNKTGAY